MKDSRDSHVVRLRQRLARRGGVAEAEPGLTIVELAVIIAVLAVMACVSVPSAVAMRGHVSVATAGRQLVVILRHAQAEAQAGATRTRVTITADGDYQVSALRDGVWCDAESGSLGAVTCTTNFPAGVIEFAAHGWPCAGNSPVPRAGTFWLRWAGTTATVVVQLTGGMRCE
jgi:Tfp pilus assembly protein FimT